MASYVKLRELIPPRKNDLNATFQQMAELLSSSEERGRVQFSIHDQGQRHHWSLELGADGPKVHAREVKNPTLEVITRAETWWEMAEGSLSPLDAFLNGKMRLRGDIEFGKRLLKHLAASEGILDVC